VLATLMTTNAMSSRASNKYWSDPMVLRYRVGFEIEVPSNLLNEIEVDIGEDMGLASVILVFDKMSLIYLCCERCSPSVVHEEM
jgi:hypothetical protein